MVHETMMPVNGIHVCVETFGEPNEAPLLLLAGDASSMDWWDDEFCRRLAAGDRFVIRYDQRDTGRSTSYPAGAPSYCAADLLHDAVGVLDALDVPAAHLVGFSHGGVLAQRLAVHHPSRVLSLTLISTSADGATPPTPPVAAGGPVAVSAGTVTAGVRTVEAPPATDETDWSDRKAAVARMIDEIRAGGGPFTADEPHLRRLAERVFDRSADLAATRLNHRLTGYGPTVRDLLGGITVPTVVLHGTLDRRFPAGHPEDLARCIPGARLVWLDGVGHESPPRAVWDQVLREILTPAA
ncbi:alpha/beta hydrolase [Actinoplanes sp. NEAU-A12]|uniref:Alpha/beta hydrolase n=1 Tax=Actinoplanes sandaracinus TaxID=3045177 RepID=A0ABT6WM30_9ACTN|nr:alpha/beta hydrolase [Actinoplanes sandaracinus]MDI6100715.1 alpha/beta hydrolase [Actinoplanes sandaracinus]